MSIEREQTEYLYNEQLRKQLEKKYNINFKLFQKIIDNLGDLKHNLTTQKNFLTRMGINERAEIISKNYSFIFTIF